MAAATHTFKYAYQVTETGTNGGYTYFQVTSGGIGGKVDTSAIDDIDNTYTDSNGIQIPDDLTQLGDVNADQFHISSATLGGTKIATYTGEGVDPNTGNQIYSEMIARVNGIGYVVFSDTPLTDPKNIAIDAAPFDLTCFATGTLIRTARGDVPVEALAVGDLAVTASGATRPIRWIGHRDIDCRTHPRPHDARPVRVAAHAFGTSLPARDLYLSPGHPVLVGAEEDAAGGHLVPVMCLINGTSIERTEADSVTYWHVELDAHDILLAEGLPAESYLDWGDRDFFAEGSDHALMNPDFVVPGLAGRCRPVALDGPVVEAERDRLDRVFAMRLATACAWPDTAAALAI